MDTMITLSGAKSTTVTNQAGETLIFDGSTGDVSGTMVVLDKRSTANSASNGEPSPLSFFFRVEESKSFEITAVDGGLNTTVASSGIYASVTSNGANKAIITSGEGIEVVGDGRFDYTVSLGVNAGICDMVAVKGSANGSASLAFDGDDVLAQGDFTGSPILTVFSDTVYVENINFSTNSNKVLITGTGTNIPGDIELIIPDDTVAKDKETLTWDVIRGTNIARQSVTSDLILCAEGKNGSTVAWVSNNTAAVSNSGAVTRPPSGAGDTEVALTAAITRGTAKGEAVFHLIVKEADHAKRG